MLLEGIFEAVISIIGRAIGYIFVELLAHIILYTTGFVLIKALTLGKHPTEFVSLNSETNQQTHVILIGLFFWLIVIIYAMVFFSA